MLKPTQVNAAVGDFTGRDAATLQQGTSVERGEDERSRKNTKKLKSKLKCRTSSCIYGVHLCV